MDFIIIIIFIIALIIFIAIIQKPLFCAFKKYYI